MFSLKMSSGWEAKFRKDAKREISLYLGKHLPRAISSAEVLIKELVMSSLEASSAYSSISSGKLRFQLGLPDGNQRIGSIVEAWVSGIEVRFIAGVGSFGSISIGIIKDDFQDVLSLPQSHLTYTNSKGQTKDLEWLRWLLTEGTSQIVTEYRYSTKTRKRGRAGGGIMIKGGGAFWRVPGEFVGTENDNFATRALLGIENKIDSIMRMTLGKL